VSRVFCSRLISGEAASPHAQTSSESIVFLPGDEKTDNLFAAAPRLQQARAASSSFRLERRELLGRPESQMSSESNVYYSTARA
jgi:hypothetical protein